MADTRSGAEIAQLVAEHHQAVYRYAYRLTGAVQDAEDLTQQVFLTAQRKIGQLRNINAAESWLFSILRNSFLKERQRQRPLLAADLDIDVDLIPTDPPSGGNRPGPAPRRPRPPARPFSAGRGDVLLRGVFLPRDCRGVGNADRHGDEPAEQGEGLPADALVGAGAEAAKAGAARRPGKSRVVRRTAMRDHVS